MMVDECGEERIVPSKTSSITVHSYKREKLLCIGDTPIALSITVPKSSPQYAPNIVSLLFLF